MTAPTATTRPELDTRQPRSIQQAERRRLLDVGWFVGLSLPSPSLRSPPAPRRPSSRSSWPSARWSSRSSWRGARVRAPSDGSSTR